MTDPSISEESILAQVLEIASAAERVAFLDRACGDNPALREEIEARLRVHLGSDKLLDLPSTTTAWVTPGDRPGVDKAAATHAESIAERPGTVIGPYKLLEQIGEGGFGVVFLAEQTQPVQRQVALKIIKPGIDSREVIARFEQERQALAMMDHPNIAKVLDAGTIESEPRISEPRPLGSGADQPLTHVRGSGRPYFVMELVKGVPFTKYCDQQHLSLVERLELFIPVCQAVQHAHQKGIIHRDLKPSNVLIALYDGKPIPKVIDFGVAKATAQKLTGRTLFTEVGQIIGTFEYMAPEQADLNNLDIDTRADIYSLGALLYRLLAGTPPFTAEQLRSVPFTEMLRMIREVEPPKPSTKLASSQELPAIAAHHKLEPKKLTKLVKGELDWIVMKALEKDRDRRYETANGLARDIQRYLADEPVQACPPSAGYRLRKFVRRNKGPVLAATTIFLVLLGGIVGTTWGMLTAKAAAKEEKLAKEEEKLAKEIAQQSNAMTTGVLDFVETKILAAARPKDQEGGLGHDVKLADAIKAALAFVEKSFTDQPQIEARLRTTMGISFVYLGDSKTAAEQHEKARALCTELLGSDHPATLESMMSLASAYAQASRNQDAIKLLE
jgi:serine/threonine protein kinase